jgi:hypothetical protein
MEGQGPISGCSAIEEEEEEETEQVANIGYLHKPRT